MMADDQVRVPERCTTFVPVEPSHLIPNRHLYPGLNISTSEKPFLTSQTRLASSHYILPLHSIHQLEYRHICLCNACPSTLVLPIPDCELQEGRGNASPFAEIGLHRV